MNRIQFAAYLWLVAALPTFLSAREPYDAEALFVKAEEVLKRDAGALAIVKIVSENRIGVLGIQLGNSSEMALEAYGVVIDEAGRIAVSRSSLDNPVTKALKMSVTVDGEQKDIEGSSSIGGLSVELADGRDYDVKIALEDHDFDIAILEPIEELDEPAESLDWSTPGDVEALEQFSPLFTLYRLPEHLDRAPTAMPMTVAAIVDKGRKMAALRMNSVGLPAYDPRGNVLGILARPPVPDADSQGASGIFGRSMRTAQVNAVSVIVPAAKIQELAEQAEKTE